MLYSGTDQNVWGMLTALKAVPTKETVAAAIDKVTEVIRDRPLPESQLAVACFDNWEHYCKSRTKNLLMHWVTLFWFPVQHRASLEGAQCPPPTKHHFHSTREPEQPILMTIKIDLTTVGFRY